MVNQSPSAKAYVIKQSLNIWDEIEIIQILDNIFLEVIEKSEYLDDEINGVLNILECLHTIPTSYEKKLLTRISQLFKRDSKIKYIDTISRFLSSENLDNAYTLLAEFNDDHYLMALHIAYRNQIQCSDPKKLDTKNR